MKKALVFLVLFLVICINAKALSCNNEREIELSGLAHNINVQYLEYEKPSAAYVSDTFGEQTRDVTYGFHLAVYNLTNDLNVKITNVNTGKAIIVNKNNARADGVVYIDIGEATAIKEYNISIRSNDSNCMNEVLRNTSLIVPMRNRFYYYALCDEIAEYDMCSEYTLTDYRNVSDTEFAQKVKEYSEKKKDEKEKKKSFFYKIANFFRLNGKYFIYGGIIIIVISLGYYIYDRRRRKLI